MGKTFTRAANGGHLRWRDRDGVLHAVEGIDLVHGDWSTYAEWTRCGAGDVPSGSSWVSDTPATCPDCQVIARPTLRNI